MRPSRRADGGIYFNRSDCILVAPPRSADRSDLTRQSDYVLERRTLRLNYGLVAIIAVTFSTLSSHSAAVTSVQATMDLTRSYSY